MQFFKKLKFWQKDDVKSDNYAETIYIIFERLFTARTPINFIFSNHMEQYSSIIIELNKEEGFFVLDELTPLSGNDLMSEQEIFHATSSDHGIAVHFEGISFESGKEDFIAYHKIKIPKHIDYQQRREACRIPLTNERKVSISLRNDSRLTFQGAIMDMSLTGFRINFSNNIANRFAVKQIIQNAHLHLNLEQHMSLCLEIKFIQYDAIKHKTYIGVKIQGISTDDLTILNQFLITLQREDRRKQV